MNDELVARMIEMVGEYQERLTPWEQDFYESVSTQWENFKKLSNRQKEILERIYAEKTP